MEPEIQELENEVIQWQAGIAARIRKNTLKNYRKIAKNKLFL